MGRTTVDGFADECRPCRELAAASSRASRFRRQRQSVNPLTRAESQAAAQAMQSWISPAKRADVEREWERAKGWAEHSQVPFPWTSIPARDYALHILREYGIALELKRGPGGEPGRCCVVCGRGNRCLLGPFLGSFRSSRQVPRRRPRCVGVAVRRCRVRSDLVAGSG